ncbi:hypothetical protein [Xanthomonas sp. GW]|uniref:hypothetical protein n=1 Tax=Xanthomonas sp. GW TaxID=2724121 RepID=UPI00163A7825|nr:hypothetical protein [Xanthomonas sp. GW]
MVLHQMRDGRRSALQPPKSRPADHLSTEVRKALEKELLAAFALTASSHPNLKASKNKLSLFSSNQKLGEIYVQHLRTADGYYAGIERYTCEAMDFCTMQQPPYPSRLLNSSFMSQSSL